MKTILMTLALTLASQAFAADSFECKLSGKSQAYQLLANNYNNSNRNESNWSLFQTSLGIWKSRCERNRDEASCSRDSACVGIYVETQQVCRTSVVGTRDTRTNEQVRVNELGVVTTAR